jgi:hypothetical protein
MTIGAGVESMSMSMSMSMISVRWSPCSMISGLVMTLRKVNTTGAPLTTTRLGAVHAARGIGVRDGVGSARG